MKSKLFLAPGVAFDSEEHEYHLNGTKLSGITTKVVERMGYRVSDSFMGEARDDGLHVHKAIEKWLKTGKWESFHPGAIWVKELLESYYDDPPRECHSEVLVSDASKYASSVDVIGELPTGLVLYDIKRTFKRTYVTWQLSVYKYFIETMTKYKVASCNCIAVRDKALYTIFPYSFQDVEEMLYGNAK